MSLELETPRAGDNSGDPHAAAFADISENVAAFLKGADVWATRDTFDERDAEKANDFITGAKQLKSKADKARAAEKKPHLDAGREIDARWGALADKLDKIIKPVSVKLEAFLRAQREERAKAQREAEERARQAEDARRAAEADAAKAETPSQQIAAEERANQLAFEASVAQGEARQLGGAARVDSATGLANRRSLKMVRKPAIASLPQALTHYRAEPELAELILKFAARDLREAPTIKGAKKIPTIPGIRWDETEQLS